jgi:hypothetical protein
MTIENTPKDESVKHSTSGSYAEKYVSEAALHGIASDATSESVDLSLKLLVPSGISIWMMLLILRAEAFTFGEEHFLLGETPAAKEHLYFAWLDKPYASPDEHIDNDTTLTLYITRDTRTPSNLALHPIAQDVQEDIAELRRIVQILQEKLSRLKAHALRTRPDSSLN